MSAALALYDGVRRPGACPLCGAPTQVAAGLWDRPERRDGCRLGTCVTVPAPGSPEARLIAMNRLILADELVEVAFSLAAYRFAISLAKTAGRPHGTYLEASFPLAFRQRVLEGYMAGPREIPR